MNIDELIVLVEQHGKSIHRFCYKLTGNKENADDLYQETFLRAVELRHKMDRSSNPKAFLIAIAVRLNKNHRRKFAWRQRIAPTAELEEATASSSSSASYGLPEEVLLSSELRDLIQDAACQLDEKLRLPLYMFYTAEMSIVEIAAA
ncbi:sigma-70 family RNA polymerase sigma factor [Paenibacillus sp. HB172176]|uniref:RNA polymerase sigma factor n=1 Tax=Paenibacillus sp. HB172176 TaxID=2493690 RepID=UPI00143BD300|nr:sigma-70 family RNA polymerase sigma factor [Paenibacillus sp. HB172176]